MSGCDRTVYVKQQNMRDRNVMGLSGNKTAPYDGGLAVSSIDFLFVHFLIKI